MLHVPYMKDAQSRRVWLDRCSKCRAIWFDAGEVEATAGSDLHLSISNTKTPAQCPACQVPLYEATLAQAPALACTRCRGVHLKVTALGAVSFKDTSSDDEPTLRPPALFECVVCSRTFSLDQGDGVSCNGCAPSATPTHEDGVPSVVVRRIGLTSLLDHLFYK